MRFVRALLWGLRSAAVAFSVLGGPCGPAVAASDWTVLLIGATNYPKGLVSGGGLSGPRNDVVLLYRTLIQLGLKRDDISVLADALPRAEDLTMPTSDGVPMASNIRNHLADLERRAAPGRNILIYFAGHGSRMADGPDGDETDGFDEVYVPLDGRLGDGGVGWANVIVDDELGASIDRMVARGALVWLVADTCFSGTFSRNTSHQEGETARFIAAPTALGRSPMGVTGPSSSATERPDPPAANGGGFVGFYAAGADEMAVEKPMPPGAAFEERTIHGTFTWSLVRALKGGGLSTFDDLARRIRAYQWRAAEGISTPTFDGNLSRSHPLLRTAQPTAYAIGSSGGSLTVEAGLIDGIANGSTFSIVRETEPDSAPLATAQVISAGIARSIVALSEPQGDAPTLRSVAKQNGYERILDWMRDTDSAQTLRAELVTRTLAFTLRIAPPVAATGAVGPDDASLRRIREALETVSRDPIGATRLDVEIQETGPADVYLAATRDRLFLVEGPGDFNVSGPTRPPSIPLVQLDSGRLSEALSRIALKRNLLNIATAFVATPVSQGLDVEVWGGVGGRLPDGTCEFKWSEDRAVRPDMRQLDIAGSLQTLPVVGHCEDITLALTNRTTAPLDLTVLHIGPWNHKTWLGMYEGAYRGALRLQPGQTRYISYTEETQHPDELLGTGPTWIYTIAVEARPGGAEGFDFGFLADGEPRTSRGVTTGAAAALQGLLDEATGGASRGSARRIDDAGIIARPYRTVPTMAVQRGTPQGATVEARR